MSEILIKVLCVFGTVFITLIGVIITGCNIVSAVESESSICRAVNYFEATIFGFGSLVWLIAALTKILE